MEILKVAKIRRSSYEKEREKIKELKNSCNDLLVLRLDLDMIMSKMGLIEKVDVGNKEEKDA
jgi:hypothetical protein